VRWRIPRHPPISPQTAIHPRIHKQIIYTPTLVFVLVMELHELSIVEFRQASFGRHVDDQTDVASVTIEGHLFLRLVRDLWCTRTGVFGGVLGCFT
jgi:hypothetical protein